MLKINLEIDMCLCCLNTRQGGSFEWSKIESKKKGINEDSTMEDSTMVKWNFCEYFE